MSTSRTIPFRMTHVLRSLFFYLEKVFPIRIATPSPHNFLDGSQNDFTRLNARVCIIPVLSPQSPITLHRLSPAHSNIHLTLDQGSTIPNLPTPIYNNTLRVSLTPKSNLLATHALQNESPAFTDALALLRVWANQRGYGQGTRLCVHGFEARGSWWAALLGALIVGEERADIPLSSKKKPLGRGLSSYQLFRSAMDFLCELLSDRIFETQALIFVISEA